MPTNLAVFEIFPRNFLSWVVKYSFSKFSLASLSGKDKLSAIENFSSAAYERDSFTISRIFSLSFSGSSIAILSIRFLNSLTLPGQL